MISDITLRLIADKIVRTADLDLCVDLSREEVMTAMRADGICPQSNEVELLIMGDDEGVIPLSLQKKYPNLEQFLAENLCATQCYNVVDADEESDFEEDILSGKEKFAIKEAEALIEMGAKMVDVGTLKSILEITNRLKKELAAEYGKNM